MNDTPRTEAAYEKVRNFTNEEEATDAVATMRDFARELEHQLASAETVCETQLNYIHQLEDRLGIPRS